MPPAPYAKTAQVITSVKPKIAEKLDAYAAKKEISRAEAIRRFIDEGLANDELAEQQVATARAAGVVDLEHDR